MSLGWPNRIRLVLTLFMILTASPVVHAMDTGTPAPPPETPIETEVPTKPPIVEEPTAEPTIAPEPTTVPTLEPAPTQAPEPTTIPTEEPEPTATTEPTSPATDEPEPTATGEPTPTETMLSPAANRSLAPEMSGQESETFLAAFVQQCEDDTRIGEFEFLPIRLDQLIAANTGLNCQPLDTSLSGTITVTPGNGVPGYTQSFTGPDSIALVGPIPSGTFTISITIGEHTGTSAELTLPPGSPLLLPITYFVAETPPQEPDEGLGSIVVSQLLCEDSERAGTSHFQVDSLIAAQSTTTGCIPAPDTESGGFVLTSPDNPNWEVGVRLPVDGVTRFDTVPAGRYQVTDYGTLSTSEPFTLSGGETVGLLAITYVDQLPGSSTDVYIEKIWCEDNERAGTTEFTLDQPPAFGPMAASATCFAESPYLERPELTVTLDNVDTDESFRTSISSGSATWIDALPAGTYTVTESGDSVDTATSDPLYISGPGEPRIRIINYIRETERPGPGEEGFGDIEGFVLYCSSPDREEGDVDFIIGQFMMPLAAVTECEVVPNATASFMLYEVDEATQEIVPGSGMPVDTGGFADFWLEDIPTGYYALAYVSPSGAEVISQPFVVQPSSGTRIEVNIFSAPAYTGDVEVYKDFCVDPKRAGQASFSVISDFVDSGSPLPQIATTASTDCRYSDEGDGPFQWTLTNVDTGQTWTSDDTEPWFEGIPTGTYTLTETWNGASSTSDQFAFDPSREDLDVYVRNYIAEHDWEPGDEEGNTYLDIWAYICANPYRDGGAEFFVFGDPDEQSGTGEGVNEETSRCRPAVETDGLTFVATPQDGGEDITFVFGGDGWFEPDTETGDVPAGNYILTESTTGTTTGIIRVTSYTYIEFYRYEPLPRARVTIDVSSAAPEIANTLPDDATWTVSQRGVELASNTFAAEHLELPQLIEVSNPVPYGTYDITVSAGPAFQPFTMSVTVDEPAETVPVVLIPVETETEFVEFSITSADLGIADRLPEGSTWTVTSDDNPALTMSGVFAPEHLQLPVTIPVDNPVPHGRYEVTINAGPVFQPYTEIFTVGGDDDDAVTSSVTRQGFFALQQAPVTFAIVLQPAPVDPTPEPSPTPDPTATPEPTVTPDPSPEPTGTPDPTGTPEPVAPTVPASPEAPAGEPTETPVPGSTISSLPSTGQGANAMNATAIVILALASILLAVTGALVTGKRRH